MKNNSFFSSAFSTARLFFAVNVLAGIGFNIGVVGVGWFIIASTGSNQLLGLYGALSLISAFITLAAAGAVMDKYAPLTLFRFCCAGQTGIFFLTALLSYFQLPARWLIYALAVFNMPLMVLFSVVARRAVASIWNNTSFTRGNAVLEITLQIGAMCAAVLTGVLYRFFGFSLLMGLAGALCLAAALLLVKWPILMTNAAPHSAPFAEELRAGWVYLVQHKNALFYGLLAFIPTVIISASNTVIPGYVEQSLGKDALTYGLGDMWFAAGALLAGLLGTRYERLQTRVLLGLFGGVMACLGVLWLGRHTGLFYGMVFALGIGLAQLRILLNTLFMKKADSAYLGRSLSLLMAVSIGFQALLSYGVGGWMDKHGAASGFVWLLSLNVIGLILLGLARSPNNAGEKTSAAK